MIEVSHFVGLSGVGGVQRNFVEYINNQSISELDNTIRHKVYTLGEVDSQYEVLEKVFDIKNLKNLFSLILDIISRKKIVHFYNNLTSIKVVLFLSLLPVHNLILHERGAIWNLSYSRGPLLRFVVWKAHLILTNSNATKIMLEKKFNITSKKVRVIHNGINTKVKCTKKKLLHDKSSIFHIGFIGRLDTPKGVHVLIEAMRHLVGKNIELVIAGDGILEYFLKKQAKDYKNISFIGRVENPYRFLSSIELLVVPSIREPLGNVCLEAGLCRIPVLAANIDGIPEIIENKVTGELINATDRISIYMPEGAVPLPNFVVNPTNQQLQIPRQINPLLLARKILELSEKPALLEYYAENLHSKVMDYFNIDRFSSELHAVYREINTSKSITHKIDN